MAFKRITYFAGGVALAASGLGGCAGLDTAQTTEDKALIHAMSACGIATSEGGEPVRDDSGNVYFDESIGESVNIDTDPLSALQSQYDDWSEVTSQANAAAQIDTSWQSLATTMTDRVGQLSAWLSTRKSGQQPSSVDPNIRTKIDKTNAQLGEYLNVCSGLALRLSSS